MWEAVTTFAFFWVLLIMAFIADKCNEKRMKKRIEQKFGFEKAEGNSGAGATQYSVVDFYNCLIPEEQGKIHESKEEEEKAQSMKEFLQKEFGTTKVSSVDKELLKQKLEGDKLIERIGFRKSVALVNTREVIKKGEIIRRENYHAD